MTDIADPLVNGFLQYSEKMRSQGGHFNVIDRHNSVFLDIVRRGCVALDKQERRWSIGMAWFPVLFFSSFLVGTGALFFGGPWYVPVTCSVVFLISLFSIGYYEKMTYSIGYMRQALNEVGAIVESAKLFGITPDQIPFSAEAKRMMELAEQMLNEQAKAVIFDEEAALARKELRPPYGPGGQVRPTRKEFGRLFDLFKTAGLLSGEKPSYEPYFKKAQKELAEKGIIKNVAESLVE